MTRPGTKMILRSNDGTITTVQIVERKEIKAECVTSDGKFFIMEPSGVNDIYHYREVVPIQLSELFR